MNLTLYALMATSITTHSPLFQVTERYSSHPFIEINAITINNVFTNFLTSCSFIVHTKVSKSIFRNFLDPPFKIETTLTNQIINVTQNFTDSFVCIDRCSFLNCKNDGWYRKGGAILFICRNSILKIHASIFQNCTCSGDGGAIYAAESNGDMNDGGSGSTSYMETNSFFSHYCCYSGCSAKIVEENNKQFSGYGSSLFAALDRIELNYSSSIERPNFFNAYGAQFDIQTCDVKSCNINATTGNSICCAAIEYRNAKSGFFRFQTIVDQVGGFITSFTGLNGPVNISYCNLVNNTIKYTNYVPACSLIHVRMKSVVISKFTIIDTKFDGFDNSNRPYFASKGNDNANEFYITVMDCIIDDSLKEDWLYSFVTTSNLFFGGDDDDIKTLKIGHLSLGDCQGVVVPPLLDATSIFSHSNAFSQSIEFVISECFSESNKFSKSDEFSKSNEFSESDEFSVSDVFLMSNKFTKSKCFSESNEFSESKYFSESNDFSVSDKFILTNKFTKSKGFSKSNEFSESSDFSQSSDLNVKIKSKTIEFIKSSQFSSSNCFSNSLFFSSTKIFSHSNVFSSSYEFSQSKVFTVVIIKNSDKNSKSKIQLIAGIIGMVAAVSVVVIVTIFLIKKKKLNHIEIEIDNQDASCASSSEAVIQNPLYGKGVDDPFQNDFAEHLASLEAIL